MGCGLHAAVSRELAPPLHARSAAQEGMQSAHCHHQHHTTLYYTALHHAAPHYTAQRCKGLNNNDRSSLESTATVMRPQGTATASLVILQTDYAMRVYLDLCYQAQESRNCRNQLCLLLETPWRPSSPAQRYFDRTRGEKTDSVSRLLVFCQPPGRALCAWDFGRCQPGPLWIVWPLHRLATVTQIMSQSASSQQPAGTPAWTISHCHRAGQLPLWSRRGLLHR